MTKSEPAPIDLSCYRQIVVLTGAGVSVASGLPTYRGIGGLWTTTSAEAYASAATLASNLRAVWEFFAEMRATIASAVPNEAHHSLARASRFLRPEQHLTVLTQNVDGLHTIAGSTDVVEVHGSLRRSRCTNCDYSRNEALGVPSRSAGAK